MVLSLSSCFTHFETKGKLALTPLSKESTRGKRWVMLQWGAVSLVLFATVVAISGLVLRKSHIFFLSSLLGATAFTASLAIRKLVELKIRLRQGSFSMEGVSLGRKWVGLVDSTAQHLRDGLEDLGRLLRLTDPDPTALSAYDKEWDRSSRILDEIGKERDLEEVLGALEELSEIVHEILLSVVTAPKSNLASLQGSWESLASPHETDDGKINTSKMAQ